MQPITAKQAWAVSYTPSKLLEMSEAYDEDALETLNEHLAKGNFVVVSDDTQGFEGDLVIDFPADAEMPYRALIKI